MKNQKILITGLSGIIAISSIPIAFGGSLGMKQASINATSRTVYEGGNYILTSVLEPINTLKGGRFAMVSKLAASFSEAPKAPTMSISSQPDGSINVNWEASSLFPFMIPQVTDGANNTVWTFSKFQPNALGGKIIVPPLSLKYSQIYKLVAP